MALTDEQLLASIDESLRTMPSRQAFGYPDDSVLAWLGRTRGLMELWGGELRKAMQIAEFRSAAKILAGDAAREKDAAHRVVRMFLNEALSDLQLRTFGPKAIVAPAGAVHDYFDGVRKVIELAGNDVLFVDPYLDAEFVTRYLPHVKDGATIRLLTRKQLATLLPAVDAFARQHNRSIEVRSTGELHDRYVFIDRGSAYQSGASFKDGAVNATTAVMQVTDAFDVLLKAYEDKWAAAKIER